VLARSWQKPSPRATWMRLACLGALCSALACTGEQLVATPALVADYPRGPGSFCALNPEGCPPAQPPAQAEPLQDLESPANKQACLDACEAGGEVLKNFCRRLRNERKRALCWGAAEGTKQACRSMCHAIYECDGSADCAHGAGQ
jgi:hypothetical protein